MDHFQRFLDACATFGLTLDEQDAEWRGWHESYSLRCEAGHGFTRSASQMVYTGSGCVICKQLVHVNRLKMAAQAKGGDCLDSTYLGRKPYRFICALGHEWQTSGMVVLNGSWCRICAQRETRIKLTLSDGLQRLQKAAADMGGVCLSDVYTKSVDRYRFRCANGHEWTTSGSDVLRGTWCLKCSHAERSRNYLSSDGLPRLQQAARDLGGECLTLVYSGMNARYRFRCVKGHEWETVGQKIMLGSFCPTCVNLGKRLTLDMVQEDAKRHGGRCISTEYSGNTTKMEWECYRGHHWWAAAATIRRGHWCPQCAVLERIKSPKSKARFKYIAE